MFKNVRAGRYVFIYLFVLMISLPLNVSLAAPEGELVMARQKDAQFLDPNVATSDRSVNGFLFGSIVKRNLYDGSYSRSLAESWEVINPTTWKFNLQKGVKFHDGTEVTSADVKFSFDRTLGKFNKKFRGYRKGAVKRLIAAVETPDDYTVIIKTRYADASFLGVPLLMQVVPKAYVEKVGDKEYARKPIGFGPFKVTEIKVGEYLKMEAFEDFWNASPKQGETGRAKVKSVIMRTLPQEATMIAALKAGEIDGFFGVNIDSVKDLEKQPDISIFRAPTSMHGFLILNFRDEKEPKTGKPNPLRDVRVRQAINYALDWDSLIKNYLTGREWRTTLIGRTQTGYDPHAPIYPYDPEKAKKLLREAGYENGLSLPYHYAESSRQPYMDAIWEYWRSVGINAKPTPHSSAGNLKGVYTKTSFGIVHWAG
ncbi:MAG: ABC transporter substrate-binding protein, partial [Deltaproteobacteria bacterium]|nr:ABC transporter substrate-binding protein [Deltaproteobacteria bacterium]